MPTDWLRSPLMISPSNGATIFVRASCASSNAISATGFGDLRLIDVHLGARAGRQRLVQLQLVLLARGDPAQPLQVQLGVIQRRQHLALMHDLAGAGVFAADIAIQPGGDHPPYLALDHRRRADVVLDVEQREEGDNPDDGARGELEDVVLWTNQLPNGARGDVESDGGEPALALVKLSKHRADEGSDGLGEVDCSLDQSAFRVGR